MKVVVGKESLRRILKWAQRALLACAVLLLGYAAFALVDAWIFQRRQSRDLDRLLRDRRAASQAKAQAAVSAVPVAIEAAAPGSLIGRIEIPRLLLSVVVIEGIDRTTLRRAVGHIPGTPLPGRPGNVGLAGHRDTFFRPLKDLRVKDEILFSTLKGNFRYIVASIMIVDPSDVGVLASTGENVLTLVTCYPFYYIGPAPQRWIVRARQVSP
jgi:sortase A